MKNTPMDTERRLRGVTVRVVRRSAGGDEVGQVGIWKYSSDYGVYITCESKSFFYPWHTVVLIEVEDDE